jgi:hypothetical protein
MDRATGIRPVAGVAVQPTPLHRIDIDGGKLSCILMGLWQETSSQGICDRFLEIRHG